IPRAVAKNLYDNSALKTDYFNTDTYEEIFSLPESKSGGEKYYATTFGDIRLVVLHATNIWRSPSLEADVKGKYREREVDFDNPEQWGYGQHIFEPIDKGSSQYNWLVEELNSAEFKQAKYKVVMLHHPVHSLGENIVPAYTNPVQIIEKDDSGKITAIRYEYPFEEDYLIKDIVPLLEENNVQLVYYGHSHLWNRFQSESGIHFLESSNVGNSYSAFLGDKKRNVPSGYKEKYVEVGNPNGLEPIVPSIKPLKGEDGKPLPYIASKEITVFSILDTGNGTVNSYYFDTTKPESEVVKFDEFRL
ncbi:MAG: metallophosphoesterase, partial [Cyanobacteria bacterium J06649_11]